MLINTKDNHEGNVRFISYDGGWPNLCSGTLVLEIHEKEYKFGNNYKWNEELGEYTEVDGFYEKFWSSGGGFNRNWCAYKGEWQIDVSKLPEEIQKYAAEIDSVFNNNVPHGCCGGCA